MVWSEVVNIKDDNFHPRNNDPWWNEASYISFRVPERDLIREYLNFVSDVLGELDSHDEIGYIHRMLENGTGADRQLKVYNETGGDLKAVVDYMAAETRAGL